MEDTLLFDVQALPLEIQDMIVIKGAVARRLSGETCGEVFAAMAPVCKRWLKLLSAPGSYEQVERETYSADPICKYLPAIQSIFITGVTFVTGVTGVINVVTLGDKLYIVLLVFEPTLMTMTSQIFSYNFDCTAIRHKEPSKRIVTCANRKRLMVHGLNASGEISGILPCPRTNTLFLLDDDMSGQLSRTVHHINPDDGTVLQRWTLGLSITTIHATSLSNSGLYIIVTGVSSVFVYCALTGVLINRVDVTAENILNGIYLAATLVDDILEDFVKLASSKKYNERNIALDDRVLLVLSPLGFVFVDTRTGRNRMLGDSGMLIGTMEIFSCWCDREHGLIFFSHMTGLGVKRITY